MTNVLLGELIEKGFLKILTSADRYKHVADFLRKTDLAIGQASGGLVAEDQGTIYIRPELVGSFDMEIEPNYYHRRPDHFNKEVLSKNLGVSVDELVEVGVIITKIEAGVGTEESYEVLLDPKDRGFRYLTVQSYYKPR